MKRWSSLRLTEAPMPVDVMWILPSVCPDARGVSDGAASAGLCESGPAGIRSRLGAAEPFLRPAVPSRFLESRASLGRLLKAGMAAHRLGAGRDRLHDVMVARASADIALELLADHMLVEVMALAIDD